MTAGDQQADSAIRPFHVEVPDEEFVVLPALYLSRPPSIAASKRESRS
jgi:hypothetical protein